MAHYINIYGKRVFDIGLYLKTSVDLLLQQQHVLMSQQKFTDISLCHREAPNPILILFLFLIHRSFHSLQNSLPIIPEQKRVIESGSVASIVEHKRTNLSGINPILSDLEESV
ncbi:hypothetical protein AXX17_AT1G35400 [Arabidopsis thaliana]|uniref:Uncharacterized protein n=1 Tax=Arabidopsis thaliana TaxID=3702 RepID=A0A178W550_ARATH|nr:hypothetical protein AXX17_AT1G35400 [Arabidopsis thaliana]